MERSDWVYSLLVSLVYTGALLIPVSLKRVEVYPFLDFRSVSGYVLVTVLLGIGVLVFFLVACLSQRRRKAFGFVE